MEVDGHEEKEALELDKLRRGLSSSSTTERRAWLEHLHQRIGHLELPLDLAVEATSTLFGTYPYYDDRGSRLAGQACFKVFLDNDRYKAIIPYITQRFETEASRPGIAPSVAFGLAELGSIFLSKIWEQSNQQLVIPYAGVLDLCMSLGKPGLRKAALTVARRAIRQLCSTTASISALVTQLTARGQTLGSRTATILGVIAGVCSRKNKQAIFDTIRLYYDFCRDIVGSRTPVPPHIIPVMADFFRDFVTTEAFHVEIVPTLDKALLRAPEVALDLLPPLVQSLSKDSDLAKILAENLLKPLLANVKSQNVAVRNGALQGVTAVIGRSRDAQYLDKVAAEISSALLHSNAVDQRSIYAQMLGLLPVSFSKMEGTTKALAQISSKESNESALEVEVQALSLQMTGYCIEPHPDPKIYKGLIEPFNKGLSDKKPAVRKIWVYGFSEMLWRYQEHSTSEILCPKNGNFLSHIIESIALKLLQVFDEIAQNPLGAGQFATSAFAILATSSIMLTNVGNEACKTAIQRAKMPERTLSTLFNSRVYSKLPGAQDLNWVVRALVACSHEVCNANSSVESRDAWAQAFVYCICTSMNAPNVRQEATAALMKVYNEQRAEISEIIIEGIWNCYRRLEILERDMPVAAHKVDNSKLLFVIRSITPLSKRSDSIRMQEQLINMLVLCRPEILPHVQWIDTCLRVGQDPGLLAQSRAEQCLARICSFLELTESSHLSMKVKVAAYNAAAELAFVAPDAIIPLIMAYVKINLPANEVESHGPTEIAIARTPVGTAFIDVLSMKGQGTTIDKNARDYDIKKWEEEMRNQIATKKGQTKKLSADEKAKVDTQLAKEAIIRKEVNELEMRLRNGIGFVHALAVGPPTEANLWMGIAIQSLTAVVAAGVGRLVDDAADQAYLACSAQITSRLGSARYFIGVATLRALGSNSLPASLLEEPLGDLVTRLLYRLHGLGEQRPFDSLSLTYMLPLLFVVLHRNGVAQEEADAAEEQITLALETISYNTDTFVDTGLPRSEILELLIESMQRFSQHYRLIKDCLLDVSRAIGENASEKEVATLLKGAIVPQASVRAAALQALREHIDLTDVAFPEEIWLACHDENDENAELGDLIWQENALKIQPEQAGSILQYLASGDRQLRRAASRALAAAIAQNTVIFDQILDRLEQEYKELAKPRVPERDAYGMVKKQNLRDPWEGRSGIALAFKALAVDFHVSRLVPFFEFLIKESAIGDRNGTVRDEMIESATVIIGLHGAAKLEELMRMFEAALDQSDASSDSSDLVSEAIVVLYGALAGHLRNGDDRIPKVVERLLFTLQTPSETVQYAVAGCLPPLVQTSSLHTSQYVQATLDELLQSKKYAARRGAAYGLAGIVKGEGVSALRKYRILSTLRTAIENKKDQNHRQGALFAYELFALILGRIFEPYIIQVVPQLLASFGDSSADVREACLDASKTCFASLSSFGVKIILPMLLEGLDETQWRSKKGACDSLGAMAYLDPQQLAFSLPDIIPPLTGVLNDSHKEVRSSANRSLQRFGEVISNPEVKGLVSILLKALSDPTKYTDEALDALIKVSFIHYLDSPSLALIVRILERALGERSASKRKSAQIIGSLAHLTERKDVLPHLPILVTGLKFAIVDPVPATRATASKALGSLVERLGEDALPDLIPGLMSTLKSDTGAGDRLGSAQALSEVLAGLGTGRLEEILPNVLQNVASSKATVREGFMSLFIYLPACFGNSFANYLSKIIPPILSGLADEVESIRETSLRAGRLLVKNFATKAIDLLLPELDRGLADDSYRIRLSSVELVGDLLFNLTGISGSPEADEDADGATEAGQSLLEVLGEEKRNKILSSLYICRNDTAGLVRSAAINVWKALVATPRTLKELVPTLTQQLIKRLASPNMEQRVIAGNALGELIRKAGEGVLSSLLPTLEEGLQASTDTDKKEGICIALKEVISAASPEALEDYEKTLISVVRIALVDADEEVREAAAEAFDSLQKVLGKKAIDQVLPYLLSLLRTESDANIALSALLTLLTDNTRSNIILPNLVPTLLSSPITSFNARALASLSEVAGPAMTRRLPAILTALMDNIVDCKNDTLRSDLEDSFDVVLLAVDEFDGLNTAMSVMTALVKNHDHRKRAIANVRLANFFGKTDVDFSRYYQDLIRVLLISFDDPDSEVVKAAWLALSELTKHLKKEEMEGLVMSTRQILQQVGVVGANLPGFSLPKGINAILPIFLQGLMNGTADQRTHAALAISDIIDRTSADSLKPSVTQITGPLIRVVSERSVEVRSAILLTLNNLLEKIPTFLKPFLPQLQRTFAKSLADASSEILRDRAAKALGTLITLTPRIDPLITELVTGSKTPDPGVQNAMLKALYEVVSKAGSNMSDASRSSILGLIDSEALGADDKMVITHARLLGALIKSLPVTFNASSLIKARVLTSHMSYASALNLNSVLLESPATLFDNFAQETPTAICQGIRHKTTSISDNYVLAAGKHLLAPEMALSMDPSNIIETLSSVLAPESPIDTKRLALVVIRTISRTDTDIIERNISTLAPAIFANVRSPVIPVKLAAEAAFVSIFSVVEKEGDMFEQYVNGAGAALNPTTKRSMQDYFKRVAIKLGSQARDRKEAEGGQGGLGLSNDEREDEREIWSVGKVDLGEKAFNDE